jgi:hypothetical protein
VITSSPGFNCRSPNVGDVSAESATRFADEPELTSDALRTPTNRANLRSNSFANRPVVNHPSKAESTTACISDASITFPETGTLLMSALKSRSGKASATYSAVRSRMRRRNSSARELILAPLIMIEKHALLPDFISELALGTSVPQGKTSIGFVLKNSNAAQTSMF